MPGRAKSGALEPMARVGCGSSVCAKTTAAKQNSRRNRCATCAILAPNNAVPVTSLFHHYRHGCARITRNTPNLDLDRMNRIRTHRLRDPEVDLKNARAKRRRGSLVKHLRLKFA